MVAYGMEGRPRTQSDHCHHSFHFVSFPSPFETFFRHMRSPSFRLPTYLADATRPIVYDDDDALNNIRIICEIHNCVDYLSRNTSINLYPPTISTPLAGAAHTHHAAPREAPQHPPAAADRRTWTTNHEPLWEGGVDLDTRKRTLSS